MIAFRFLSFPESSRKLFQTVKLFCWIFLDPVQRKYYASRMENVDLISIFVWSFSLQSSCRRNGSNSNFLARTYREGGPDNGRRVLTWGIPRTAKGFRSVYPTTEGSQTSHGWKTCSSGLCRCSKSRRVFETVNLREWNGSFIWELPSELWIFLGVIFAKKWETAKCENPPVWYDVFSAYLWRGVGS